MTTLAAASTSATRDGSPVCDESETGTVPAVPAAVPPSPRKTVHDPGVRKRAFRRRSAFIATLALASLSLAALTLGSRSSPGPARDAYVPFTVGRIDLPITITERGTLESQSNLEILCEVDDVPGDGIHGTPILWLVENGSSVREGDLLIELDASSHLERVDQQVLERDKAEARAIQARVNYENRKSRNEAAIKQADLDVELARLALQQYEDEQGGTYQIELQDIELAIQECEASKEIADTNLAGVEYLFELGYKSKGDLAQAQLRALRAENALVRERARREELVKYRYTRTKKKLEGELESLRRARIQVERNNEALLQQALAMKESAELSLERVEEQLERYRQHLTKCKIYAPRSGMVAYAVESGRWGGGTTIAEGVAVRDRQRLMTLPDLSRMQVKTSVHESVVDRVKTGMNANIRLDAFPDRRYSGLVKAVAVLPDQGGWLSSDTKVYETIVEIAEEVEQLKPGMTAVVELLVDHLEDVLAVPVQAFQQKGKDTWCYVAEGARVRRQTVSLGQTNDKFVEVLSGLSEGDQVVLNPSAIVQHDETEQKEIAADATRGRDVAL